MPKLKRSYVHIRRSGTDSYGGSQMWSFKKTIRQCACGPVAALDTLLYLTECNTDTMSSDEYLRELEHLCRRYFPLLPPFGINGLLLAAGMNMLMREQHLPYRAYWAVSGSKFWDRIASLLEQDIPAIFSVGPNFPAVWQKHSLTLYSRRADGSYFPSSSAHSHYVTATGLDGDWLRISSWGKEYYINRREYDEYVRKHSLSLVSNLLMLQKVR
jgi:hypothetical protein